MEDKIIATCQSCNGQFKLPAKFAGKTIRCPQCQQALMVPQVDLPRSNAPTRKPAPPVRKTGGARIAAWDKAQQQEYDEDYYEDEEYYDDEPVRQAPRKIQSKPGRSNQRRGSDPRASGRGKAKRPQRRDEYAQRDRYGRYDDRFSPPKKNNMPIFIGIGATVLILLIVVIAIAASGPAKPVNGDPNNVADGTNDNPNQPKKLTEAEKKKREADNFINTLKEICDKSLEDKNVTSLYDTLSSYKNYLDKYEGLEPVYKDYADKFFNLRKEMIDKIEDEEQKGGQLYKLGLNILAFVNDMDKAKPVLEEAKQYADSVSDFRLIEKINNSLGWKKYEIPTTEEWDEIQTLMIEKELLEALYQSEEQWLPPEEYDYVKDLESQIYNSYKDKKEHWEAEGGFGRRVQQVRVRLYHDPFMKKFKFNVVEQKPFAILLEEDESREWSEVVDERTETLSQFWDTIKKDWIIRLGMKSNMAEAGDTLDNPYPFSFVSFKDRTTYDEFMEGVDKTIPTFARAFYSPVTECVMFYQDTKNAQSHFEYVVVAHESTHMVHDRFANNGLKGLHSYLILEGFAEYMGAHKKVGDKFVFQDMHYPERMQMFGITKQVFDTGTYANAAVKTGFPMPAQDWQVVPIEALVTMRHGGYVFWYGNNLSNYYANIFGQYYQQTGDKKFLNKATFIQRNKGGEFIHGMFYATAWAFTQFMNQRYKDQYDKLFMRVTNGEEVPIVFNEVMELGLTLPTIDDLWGPKHIIEKNNKQIMTNLISQMRQIHDSPKVQALQKEFNTWIEVNYEKVMGRKLPNPDPK